MFRVQFPALFVDTQDYPPTWSPLKCLCKRGEAGVQCRVHDAVTFLCRRGCSKYIYTACQPSGVMFSEGCSSENASQFVCLLSPPHYCWTMHTRLRATPCFLLLCPVRLVCPVCPVLYSRQGNVWKKSWVCSLQLMQLFRGRDY